MPPALVVGGVVLPPDATPPSAAAWLRDPRTPRGAYTAMTVLRGELVRFFFFIALVCARPLLRPAPPLHLHRPSKTRSSSRARTQIPHWQWHTERLASSLVDLAAAHPDAFPAFTAWHAGGPEARSPLPLASHLSNEALPPLAAAVRAAGAEPGADVGAVLLLTDAGEASSSTLEPPLDVQAFAWALPPPGARAAPGRAVVAGPLRAIPAAKDSAWAAQREGLEAGLPPGVADGLLTAECGALVEGLVTNLFVVQARGGGEGGGPAPPFTLRTASPADGALDGVARRVVLALAAAQPGLVAVDERPPDPAERGAWAEAFLTNAVRGVQPLTGLAGPSREDGGGGPAWSVEFGAVPGPVTAALAGGFWPALAEHATRLPRP
jgi:branched-subunit amino acid aminotransferase/4-amino-4-deoxychorismate lyase